MTEFKSKFRETLVGVPTVQIQTNTTVEVSCTGIGGGLIQPITGDDDTNLVRAN